MMLLAEAPLGQWGVGVPCWLDIGCCGGGDSGGAEKEGFYPGLSDRLKSQKVQSPTIQTVLCQHPALSPSLFYSDGRMCCY